MVQNEKNTGRRPLVTKFHTVPLWDYTIAVYRRSGVAAACLELQHSVHARLQYVDGGRGRGGSSVSPVI